MPAAIERKQRPKKVEHCPDHRNHMPGCHDCTAYSRYRWHRWSWEQAHGINQARQPAGPVREHVLRLRELMGPATIAHRSGMSLRCVWDVLSGERPTVSAITAESLLAVPVPDQPMPRMTQSIPALEARRIIQGLQAQGWTYRHLGRLLGGVYPEHVRRMTDPSKLGVTKETLTNLRDVAVQLVGLDIHNVPSPVHGMDWRSANCAAKKGWPPLSRWLGLDLADPTTLEEQEAAAGREPAPCDELPAGPEPDAEPWADEFGWIDPVLRHRVAAAAELVASVSTASNETAAAWVDPIGPLTRLEMHAVWWHAETIGLNDTHIGRMLGYPMDTATDKDAGQRQANRLREKVEAARAWIDQHPRGWIPRWFTWGRAAGRDDFLGPLCALMALQPAPFGAGWTIVQLAEQCGLPEDEMRTFLSYAARLGDQPWKRQSRRQLQLAACPIGTVEPVQLDQVLADWTNQLAEATAA